MSDMRTLGWLFEERATLQAKLDAACAENESLTRVVSYQRIEVERAKATTLALNMRLNDLYAIRRENDRLRDVVAKTAKECRNQIGWLADEAEAALEVKP